MAASPVTDPEMDSDNTNDESPRMVPARRFSISDLPEGLQDVDLFKLIQCMTGLTGKIETSGTPYGYGTGFIQRIRFVPGKCPCSADCEDKTNRFAIVTVSTVVHIFDNQPDRGKKGFLRHVFDQEPQKAEIKLEYKRYDVIYRKLLTLYGHRLVETDKDLDIKSDWCCLEFVSHEVGKVKKLNETLNLYQKLQGEVYQKYKDKPDNLVVVVGHPDGDPMQISIGKKKINREYEVIKEIRDGQIWGRYYYDAPTETGSSGSPVFVLGQPISGFGYWFGHPHNHAAGDGGQENNSSIGVKYLVI